ncbi:predicted protein [Plenodomus lingam JN3]|uniref:Predicted protein n=1 Tax=Leptosphaeria maculans (strain JN3 / isolate v23.1.3 / race Av1-4-5-6-7-8) TaxID=985895 RepID=E4ZMK4_LEPMJ|nr:predicted protein [Plenodomus lingam JN3]CBX92873.1 predicted protein [Plenodomus lingam JN3]
MFVCSLEGNRLRFFGLARPWRQVGMVYMVNMANMIQPDSKSPLKTV